MIDIYIVAGIRLLREGLTQALSETPSLHVTAAAARCDELVVQLAEGRRPVLLLDVANGGGLADLVSVMSAVPDLRAVVLGVSDDEAEIISYAEAGAAGYLTRDGSVADLVQMIEGVARDELSCSPKVAAALIRRVGALAAGRRPATGLAGLTERELEILRLIALGLSNKEIAARLYIALATVKNHVHNVLDKLEVRTRADAATRYKGSSVSLR
jgi:DNA-binding NarL/FixJ family response regulator